jgi:uncharacterized protein YaaQ
MRDPMAEDAINQLVIVVVSGGQSGDLTQQLRAEGFYFTQLDSWGSLLEEQTLCLLIGLNEARQPKLLSLIRACCHVHRQFIPARLDASMLQVQPVMIEAELGGAVIYTLAVERFVQL